MIKTVLGNIEASEINAVLCHEHICCYSEYLRKMSGNKNFCKEELCRAAVSRLKDLKQTYDMNLFVDCTPVNIGRDIELLKAVSEKSGVHIVCSTGFYYSEEVILRYTPTDVLTEYYINDAKTVNAGIIKAAVEDENLSEYDKKLLIVSANTHKETGLPIVLHTNAKKRNGLKALEILIGQGVSPSAVTVGHLSDTEDVDYISEVAEYGCYIGLDRLHNDTSEEYISKKMGVISKLIDAGITDRLLLSHDELIYSEFDTVPQIDYNARYNFVFDYILNKLPKETAEKIIRKNAVKMLNCK